MKKIVSFIVLIAMMATFAPGVFADVAGDRTISVDLSSYETLSGGEYNGSTLKLNAGGTAVYQVYIPFNAQSVEFLYSLRQGVANSKIYMNGVEYANELTNSSDAYFFESAGTKQTLLQGEYQLVLTVDKPVEFTSIKFSRALVFTQHTYASYETVPDLTDYEKAIQTAVILSSDSPVFMVNGGRRYVNNDDPRELPYVEGNEIYLPIHSFSRAFEYYYEQKGEEWVITKTQHTFHYKNGVLTRQDYESKPYAITNDVSKVINGKVYLRLKYFAELSGETVKKQNNIFIVDFLPNVKQILKNETFNELSKNFADWKLQEKSGKTYYVSKGCNSCDDNDGSYEKPFKSIQKAASVAQAGDTVIIRGGTYNEIIAPKNNGTVSNPIVFKAAEGEKVTLSAGAELGSPIGTQKNVHGKEMLVYTALTDLGDGRNQVFYKNDNLLAGRHPNQDTLETKCIVPENLPDVWPVQGNIKTNADTWKSLMTSTTDLDQPAGTWNGATVVSLQSNGWSLSTAKVGTSEPGKLNLSEVGIRWWYYYKPDHETDYAYITDHINTIDKPGEWAYNDGKIYILPPEGETAQTLKLEQKVRQICVDLSDNKYIRIEGIDTLGGGMKLNNSEMCMLRDGEYRYISHYTFSHDQRDGYISNCDALDPDGEPQRGEMGIYVGGRDNIIINNKMEYSAAAAIYSVGLYEYIENNYVADCGYMGSYCGGIFVSTEGWEEPDTPRGGNAVYSNTVTRAGRHCYGVSTTESWYGSNLSNDQEKIVPCFLPDEVAYNDFYDGSITARDTGIWYQYGCVMGTTRLKSRHHNNLVWGSWGNEGAMNAPLYYDGYTSMAQVYDNITFQTSEELQEVCDTYVPIYIQTASSAFSVTDVWGNKDLGVVTGGKAALTKNDYPGGKIFKSGAEFLAEDKTPYLNTIDEKTSIIGVENIELSDGAKLEKGLVTADKNGAYVCFKDVDFTTEDGNANSFTLSFAANPCNTNDKISVVFGESLTDYAFKDTMIINSKNPYDWCIENTTIPFAPVVSGKTNVYIVFEDYKSLKISSISVNKVDSGTDTLKVGIYADTGTGLRGNGTFSVVPSEIHKAFGGLQRGDVIKFEGVNVPEACNEFLKRMTSSGNYGGQLIKVRLGSETGEIICEFNHTSTKGWEDYSEVESIPLKRTLEAGTYDIYIEFVGSGLPATNFLWFGFGANPQYN